MSDLTAGDIVARGLRMSRRDPSRQADADEGLDWLNEIHRAILSDGTPWTFLSTTGQAELAPGVQRYDFTSLATALGCGPIERILAVINDSGGARPLKAMEWTEFERISYDSQDDPQQRPVAYTQLDLGTPDPTVAFWPVPDQAYTMGFLVRLAVPELAATDAPLIPDSHASAVLSPYIAARMWDQRAGWEAVQVGMQHQNRHEVALRRLIDAYGSGRMEDMTFIDPTLYDHLDYGPFLT